MPPASATPRIAMLCLSVAVFAAALSPRPLRAADPAEIPVPPITTALAPLPGVDALPEHPNLPDPLIDAPGVPITSPDAWPARRAEMQQTLTYYATGLIPPPPGNVRGQALRTATVLDGTANYRLIHLSFGPNQALGFDVALYTPITANPDAPCPIIVFLSFGPTPGADPLPLLPRPPTQGKGINALLPVDPSLPPPVLRAPDPTRNTPEFIAEQYRAVFERGYALAIYHYQDTGEDTIGREPDGSWSYRTTRYYPAYPSYDWGLLAGWAWGASRVADYLLTDPIINGHQLIVTGHSRLGKATLVAGAFDDRFALVAPVGTGGGGTGVYRFSGEGRGGKEGLDEMMRKYPNWFSPHLHPFRGHADRLPFDQHWFIALVAPRPFIALEGTTDNVSLASALEKSVRAAQPVYDLLGVSENLGVNYAEHGHAFAPADWAALLDFADLHLRAKPVTRTFNTFYEATP